MTANATRLPVHERVVLNQALEQCGRFVNERVVIPGLWAMQRGLECARITKAACSAVTLDQQLMKEQRISSADVFDHFANDR